MKSVGVFPTMLEKMRRLRRVGVVCACSQRQIVVLSMLMREASSRREIPFLRLASLIALASTE